MLSLIFEGIETSQELEGVGGQFRAQSREFIRRMSRSELIEWLEFRGMACYDHESTELLRETALDDYNEELAAQRADLLYSSDPV